MHYDPKLDGLRAIAAILVVAFHAKVPQLSGGFLGVDIFFVLSGYLITKLLVDERQKTNQINYCRFYTRRLWRLYPALLLLITVYALLAPILYPQYKTTQHYQDIVLSGLYLADYARAFDIPLEVLSHTWSLSVEMHFYLLWPLILALILKLPKEHIRLTLSFMWIAATLWRWQEHYWLQDWRDIYDRADTHCSGLIFGALLTTINPIKNKLVTIIGFMLTSLAMAYFRWRMESTTLFGFSLTEIGAAMIILAAPTWMGSSILAWLGKMSYGLYLWHYPVIHIMRNLDASWQTSLITALSIGIALAAISYYLIEQPILKRHRKNYQMTKTSN
ncbi:acyltransferase family protein [Aliamphritea ceti]|uniref:acyltransferase family protein n=1 Tax=Aliamphritea ceti TaxID=1524258 RepID=UPI0021C30F64|nr:acyltransferase [Aliamphritea ceti]